MLDLEEGRRKNWLEELGLARPAQQAWPGLGSPSRGIWQLSSALIIIEVKMSAAEAEADMCCASCGIAELDDIKLKKCDACDLVRYCSDKCQQDHSQQHETVCKERAAELRDEILFRQPEGTHRGDCPICCLPFSIDMKNSTKSALYTCCSTLICDGCIRQSETRE